jgi:hypothetical protein
MHIRHTPGPTRRVVRLAAPLALALAVGVVSPTAALAAKGGKGASTSVSSITLDQAGQNLVRGDTVTFTSVASALTGSAYPMVYVECSSAVDGTLLYGQLDYPKTGFVLGGGSSQWWSQDDPAHCLGHLYAYGAKDGSIRELAAPVPFDAAG